MLFTSGGEKNERNGICLCKKTCFLMASDLDKSMETWHDLPELEVGIGTFLLDNEDNKARASKYVKIKEGDLN